MSCTSLNSKSSVLREVTVKSATTFSGAHYSTYFELKPEPLNSTAKQDLWRTIPNRGVDQGILAGRATFTKTIKTLTPVSTYSPPITVPRDQKNRMRTVSLRERHPYGAVRPKHIAPSLAAAIAYARWPIAEQVADPVGPPPHPTHHQPPTAVISNPKSTFFIKERRCCSIR